VEARRNAEFHGLPPYAYDVAYVGPDFEEYEREQEVMLDV
jgi:hypothetical protein